MQQGLLKMVWKKSFNNTLVFISVSTFSNENKLVWTSANKTKMLEWSKMFCFALVEAKMDTFNKALVCLGLIFQSVVEL